MGGYSDVGRMGKPAFPCDFLVAAGEESLFGVMPNWDGSEEGQEQLQGPSRAGLSKAMSATARYRQLRSRYARYGEQNGQTRLRA